MTMGENLTLYKSMTLLKFTLRETGFDPLTTKLQKVVTGLSYYCCMVNYLLTCKKEKIKGEEERERNTSLLFLFKQFNPFFSLSLFEHGTHSLQFHFWVRFECGQESPILQMTFCIVDPVCLSI